MSLPALTTTGTFAATTFPPHESTHWQNRAAAAPLERRSRQRTCRLRHPIVPSTIMKLSQKLIESFCCSPAMHRIAGSMKTIQAAVRHHQCTIIPVAVLARLMGVSNRVVWNWIDAGLLQKVAPEIDGQGCRTNRRGVSKAAASTFLTKIAKAAGCGFTLHSKAGRPRMARKAVLALTSTGNEGLRPAEFARRCGVSTSSVYRAIDEGVISAHRVTPMRWRIGKGRSPRKKR